ncbi:MAG: type II secretion system protein GspG [Candidatus Methylomirabilales bacterium]
MFKKQAAYVTVAGILLLVAVGCGENPVEQYGKEVIQAQGRAKRVKGRADMQALKTAIQHYHIEEGRFPDSLEDLPVVQDHGIDLDLFVYDPSTGSVQLR